MTDLIAVAAFGRVQGLTNDECRDLYGQVVRMKWEPTLERLDRMIMAIKVERGRGQRDGHQPVMTHEEWRGLRTGTCGYCSHDVERHDNESGCIECRCRIKGSDFS